MMRNFQYKGDLIWQPKTEEEEQASLNLFFFFGIKGVQYIGIP